MKKPGLQRERTGLSWSRTGFLMMLVALLSGCDGLVHGSREQLCAAALLGRMAGVLLYRGYERSRYDDDPDEVVAAPSCRLALLTCMAAKAVALLHIIDVLTRMRHL